MGSGRCRPISRRTYGGINGLWFLLMVFPLGMYGAATYRMRAAIDLEALGWLPKVEFAVSLTAWTITFGGLGWTLAGALRVRAARR